MIAHISIFIAIFSVTLALVNWLPEMITTYRERYRLNLFQTTRELNRFFVNIKPVQMIGVFVVLGILLFIFTGSWILAGALCVSGFFAPRIILTIYKDIRSAQFDTQLMDALILMGNSMKSGLDIAMAVERVATSLKPPISEEFGLVLNAYRLGAPLETSLMDLTSRIRSRNLDTVVYAIIIQRETGGNILKTFDQLVLNIRDENKLQKKVQALTSQGRAQIYVLAIMPWVLAVFFYMASPEMMQPALASTWGQIVIVFLLAWEALGIIVTKKVITVEV
jgi:tight adherence protein B